MDGELTLRKHVARSAEATILLVDEYCQEYKEIFPEVRSYEHFKWLHVGIVAEIKRKSLPEIAKAVGMKSSQGLHHFLTTSPWSVEKLREKRIEKTRSRLEGRKITVVIDETGDRKKGKTTDYVSRQYLGSVGKIDNGMVSVNAYGIYENMTFPLLNQVFKPQKRLKESDSYKSQIKIASEIVSKLVESGFKIELVLADSLYGESSQFIKTLEKHNLPWVVAIRSNHGVWMPSHQQVRSNRWSQFQREFSEGKSEIRYIREIIYGRRQSITYWEVTTDPETLPAQSTSFIMTNLQGKLSQLKSCLGNLYGQRTWIEYSFRQCKQELGWTDYRFTDFASIEKWWELILSAYLMISLHTPPLRQSTESVTPDPDTDNDHSLLRMSKPPYWQPNHGWKNTLNNIRVLMKPSLLFWAIVPWFQVFPDWQLLSSLRPLLHRVNQFQYFFSSA